MILQKKWIYCENLQFWLNLIIKFSSYFIFNLKNCWVIWPVAFLHKFRYAFKRRCLAQMCFLRHALDLFRGCRLQLVLDSNIIDNPSNYLDYLSLLQPTKPFYIDVSYWGDEWPELQTDKLLRVPILLNCPWLSFYQVHQ